MESNNTSADDLKIIRKIMEESSRFISLSGLSGILAGVFAITGALFAWVFILERGTISYITDISGSQDEMLAGTIWKLVIDGLIVLILSVSFAAWLSYRKAVKAGKKIWMPVSKRLLWNLFIPLFAGGIFTIILLLRGDYDLIVPSLLIFYGLALVNAGKFTFGEITWLGLLEVLTGLAAALFPAGWIWFWILGFGILHIFYGFLMYRKYEP